MSKVLDAREEFYFHQTNLPPGSQAPIFEQLPGTGRIVEGSDARFECRIKGNPAPRVTWTRKGIPVVSDHRRTVTYDPFSGLCTLTIRNLTGEDDGEYKCTAVNVAGEASLTIDIQRNDPTSLASYQGLPFSQQLNRRQQSQMSTDNVTSRKVESREQVIESKQVFQSQAVERCFSSTSEGFYASPTGVLSPASQMSAAPVILKSEKVEAFAEQTASVQEFVRYDNPLQQIQAPASSSSLIPTRSFEEKQKYHHKEEHTYSPMQAAYSKPKPQQQPLQQQQPQYQQLMERQRVIQEQQRIMEEQQRMMETQRIQEQIRLQEEQRQRELERIREQQHQRTLELQRMQQQPKQPIVREQRQVAMREEKRATGSTMEESHRFQENIQRQEYIYDEPENLQPLQKVQKVAADSSVFKREARSYKQFSQEDKENQEQIYLRHLAPTEFLEPDPRPSEIVHLRHIVPSCVVPESEPVEGPRGPPRFTKVCPDITILEGNVARFDCRYESKDDPQISIEWFHDGRPLMTGSRFSSYSGSGHVFLNIMDCIKEDSGEYVCRASNKYGSDQVRIMLNVIDKSELNLKELDEETIRMEKFQILEDATRFQRETHIEEEKKMRPRFLTQFKSLIIPEGETAHFECKIEPQDDPTLKIQWFQNGHDLAVGSRWQHFQDFGFISLNITHCVEEDTGTYVCRIINTEGYAEQSVSLQVVTSSTLKTDTIHPDSLDQISYLEQDRRGRKDEFEDDLCPPRFLSRFKDQRIFERQAAHFEARIEPVDDPNLKIEWFFNGMELPIGSRWQHFQDFGFVCLNILQCVIEDTGEYICRISNAIGYDECSVRLEVISTSETIDREALEKFQYLEDSTRFKRETEIEEEIRMAPRFVTPFKNVELEEGHVAHFECRIEPVGDPDLKIEWFFNDRELMVGSRYQPFHDFGFVSLNILQCVSEDTGTYTCRLTNKIGTAAQSVQLKCISRSDLILDTQHPDSLSHIQYLEDGRRYQRTEVSTPVPGAPRFLTPFKDQTVLEREAAHFEARIEPVEDPNLKIEWFKEGQELPIGSRWHYFHDFGFVCLNVLQCVIEDTGEYICRATNAVGSAEERVRLTVVTSVEQLEENMERFRHLEEKFVRREDIQDERGMMPRFLTQFRDVSLRESETAHFECRIEPTNDPKLKVEWFFNGKELQVGSRYQPFHDFGFVSLNITRCVEEDTGTYVCRLSNEVGWVEQSVNLKCSSLSSLLLDPMHPDSLQHIQYLEEGRRFERGEISDPTNSPPRFLTPFDDATIRESQIAHFECRIEPVTDPKLKVEWFKDGQPLPIGSRFQAVHDFGFVCLNITQTIAEDSGRYTCRLTNELGTAESSVNLQVLAAGSLFLDTQHPSSLKKIQDMESSGGAQQPLSPEPSLSPPRFVKPFEDVTIEERHVAHFEARIEPVNDPTLKVEWFRDGVELPIGSRWQHFHDFGFISLNILQCLIEDTGRYTCRLTNSVGTAESTIRLTVTKETIRESIYTERMYQEQIQQHREEMRDEKYGPPRFVTPFHELHLAETQLAHFECRVEPASDPSLKVEWFRNGQQLQIGSRYQTFHDFGYVFLNIHHVVAEDSGTYVCRATNSAGTVEQTATLTVTEDETIITSSQHPDGLQRILQLEDYGRYISEQLAREQMEDFKAQRMAPVFVVPPQPVVCIEGDVAKFQCRIIGYPRPRIMWVLNGNTCVNGSRYKLTYDGIYHFEVLRARLEDDGKLEVFARNIVGEASCYTTLTVKSKRSDYRAVLKNSPRPWYDHDHARYQKERYMNELDQVFEEKLTPGGTEVKVWRTEQTDEGHVKVQQTLTEEDLVREIPEMRQYKTDIFYANKSQAAKSKKEDESNVSWMAKSYQQHIGAGDQQKPASAAPAKPAPAPAQQQQQQPKPQSQVRPQPTAIPTQPKQQPQATAIEQRPQQKLTTPHSQQQQQQKQQQQQTPQKQQQQQIPQKQQQQPAAASSSIGGEKEERRDISSVTQKQVQKEYQGDLEVTRHITQKDTLEKDHKKLVQEVQVKEKGQRAASPAGQAAGQSVPPSFVVKVSPAMTRAGQDACFKCEFRGSPTPTITWMKDDVAIQPSTKYQVKTTANMSVLLVRNTTPNDSAVFAVKAENRVGVAKCSANLVVESGTDSKSKTGAPSFVKTIQPVVGSVSELLRLDARISGAKPMTVHWLRDGEDLAPDMTHKMVEEDDLYTLLILEAAKDDRGVYECVAVNGYGEARCQATVDVLSPGQKVKSPPPSQDKAQRPTPSSSPKTRPSPPKQAPQPAKKPEVKEPLKNLSVHEGKEVVFKAKISGAAGSEITWFKGNDMIKPSRFFRISVDGQDIVTLTIAEAFPEDEGVYKCQVSNPAGTAVTTASLKVLLAGSGSSTPGQQPGSPPVAGVPPSLTAISSTTVIEGKPARFLTSVKGDPKPVITWYREGVEIKPSRDFNLYQDSTTASLVIKQTYIEDSGVYVCRAVNPHGQTESSATLTVTPQK